jgi:2-polyprenyl-3-methyl-5-hydroxy-6-metoxy-1,4-benzoquinol methylase
MKKPIVDSDLDFADNYSKFTTFCDIQPDRNNRLAKNITDALMPKELLSILDIGSSDGRIIPNLINKISEKSIQFNILAMEPDKIAFEELLLCSKNNGFETMSKSYEVFSKENKNKFDLILATHVLYHFDDCTEIIKSIVSFLHHGGQAILTIDSSDSPLYQRRDAILQDNSTNFFFYGKYFFAEHLRKIIEQLHLNVKEIKLMSNLEIQITSNIEECKLVEAISFLHRIDISSITNRQEIRNLFSDFISNDSLGELVYKIPWREAMFVISIQ